jgi:hypothetical protein
VTWFAGKKVAKRAKPDKEPAAKAATASIADTASERKDPVLEQQALIMTRDLVVQLLGKVNSAFNKSSEDLPLTDTTENARRRYAIALQSVAAFFERFSPLLAKNFFELASAFNDHKNAAKPAPNMLGDVSVKDTDIVRVFGEFVNRIGGAFGQPSELSMTPEENERLRYVEALGFAGEIFRTLRIPYAHRFFELGFAISDLNIGIVSDLLAPSYVRGRKLKGIKPHTSQVRRAQARVALGLSALLRSEEMSGIRRPSLDAAAIDIANRYQGLAVLAARHAAAVKDDERQRYVRPGKVKGLPATIKNWRKEFMASRFEQFDQRSRIPNWEAVLTYDEGKKSIEAMTDPRELKEFAWKQLNAAAEFAKVLSASRNWREKIAESRHDHEGQAERRPKRPAS